MPRVLIESMALGRVVIATDVVGCNELISNNENGILCRVKNISDLYDKILLVKNKSILNKNSFTAIEEICNRNTAKNLNQLFLYFFLTLANKIYFDV